IAGSVANAELAGAVAGPSSLAAGANQQTDSQQQQQQSKSLRGNAGGATSSMMIRRRMTHIPARKPVLLRLANGKLKSVELNPGKNVSLGKFGTFKADDIIGLPFGLTFEITMPNKGEIGELKMVISSNAEELEDNQATNEKIQDGQKNNPQTMTYLDIRALKEGGAEGRDIVEQQVLNNSTFAQRTSWSQQKYIFRKEAKHMRLFTPVPPSLTNVVKYHFDKFDRDASDKLRGLRADSLANILSLAGVAPGRRYLVVDGIGGLLVGAMLERMAGEGRLLLINDSDSPPPLDLMAQFDLPVQFVDPVLRTINWANTESDWQSFLSHNEQDHSASAEVSESNTEAVEVTAIGRPMTDRDRQRMKKKQAIASNLERLRSEYFDGEFDGLVVISKYEPVSIIERVLPRLAGSANIVVHSPFIQTLIEAHAVLRSHHSIINLNVSEPFQRRYQVLPGRMHPEMMTSATGGYILHGIRVLSEEE
ncbi:Gcd10p-domain-containing protein, partial [Meira miltonrushii]